MQKKGIVADYLPWLIIGLAILVIILISIFVLKGKGFALVDQLKNLFKFQEGVYKGGTNYRIDSNLCCASHA